VSALVHSSTLVTAGVYILFRFDYLISYLGLNKIILFIGVLTIFIARLRAFFEIDIKKIVALSTLSQLGVIITALGAGFRLLRFFHLLAHAFFKALLFIRAGNLIHRFERYQDLRVIGGASEILPFTKSIIIGCSIRLCGLPFMSAFYSKEIIIERLLTYNLSFISYFIIILGVLITIFYRIRFMVISIVSVTRQRSLFNKSDIDFKVNIRIILLFIPATTGGSMVNFFLDTTYFFLVRSKLKLIILFLLILGFIYFFKLYKLNLTTYTSLL
jgi:NADH-ubiquinone oxidoreductase chain 5